MGEVRCILCGGLLAGKAPHVCDGSKMRPATVSARNVVFTNFSGSGLWVIGSNGRPGWITPPPGDTAC